MAVSRAGLLAHGTQPSRSSGEVRATRILYPGVALSFLARVRLLYSPMLSTSRDRAFGRAARLGFVVGLAVVLGASQGLLIYRAVCVGVG